MSKEKTLDPLRTEVRCADTRSKLHATVRLRLVARRLLRAQVNVTVRDLESTASVVISSLWSFNTRPGFANRSMLIGGTDLCDSSQERQRRGKEGKFLTH